MSREYHGGHPVDRTALARTGWRQGGGEKEKERERDRERENWWRLGHGWGGGCWRLLLDAGWIDGLMPAGDLLGAGKGTCSRAST